MKSLTKPRDRDEDEGDGRRRSRETGTKTKKTRSAAWALRWDLGKKRDLGFHNFQCFIFNFRPSQRRNF
ncbi:hypothetical protein NC651_035177 [Populus alba x Populus x berolinensis]|nr:hypothetical protein NC651_035177 [Populus alba x Populus x berolinensis]